MIRKVAGKTENFGDYWKMLLTEKFFKDTLPACVITKNSNVAIYKILLELLKKILSLVE